VTGDEAGDVPRWKVFGERVVYDNPWVRLVQVDVEPPDGHRFWHHVVRLQTVALAVVVDDADRALMLLRHRFATDEVGWELPGGIVGPDETAAGAAVREAEEETGWRPGGTPQLVVRFQPMPGMVDTPHEVYLVRGAQHIGDPTDLEEAGRVDWIDLADVPGMVSRGEILGSGSLVGLLAVLVSRAKGEF
jgi:8-oxo-dGTP pyrophosphatase MutT (NUDIX family)